MPTEDTETKAPLAIIMITLNEAHNMEGVLESIAGLAQEIFLVDSYSTDETVEIARRFGVQVVQRPFSGFGDQWNYAVNELPITAPWTMKLDPDERVTEQLARSIRNALARNDYDGLTISRRLWFMGKPMPVRQNILRIWRTGKCRFTNVLVNEHPKVDGPLRLLNGDLEHHDSPNLHHWFEKQNHYTTAEAKTAFEGRQLAADPRLFGTGLERRMWVKQNYQYLPFRHVLMFLYCYIWLGAWRAGRPGFVWSRMRAFVFRMREHKLAEMKMLGQSYNNQAGASNSQQRHTS